MLELCFCEMNYEIENKERPIITIVVSIFYLKYIAVQLLQEYN